MKHRPPLRKTLANAARLCCPNCGRGRLFSGWFRMRAECSSCSLWYFREEGYFLGAMFLNFIASSLLIIGIYVVLLLMPMPALTDVSTNRQVGLWILFGALLCLALMRHSYSLWLAIDFWLSPWPAGPPPEV